MRFGFSPERLCDCDERGPYRTGGTGALFTPNCRRLLKRRPIVNCGSRRSAARATIFDRLFCLDAPKHLFDRVDAMSFDQLLQHDPKFGVVPAYPIR
jgi:hypothetical protein